MTQSFEEHLRSMADSCAAMGSMLYGKLLAQALDDYRSGGPVRAFFDERPERRLRSLPGLRLLAALHYLALIGDAPDLAKHFPSCGGDGDASKAWAAAVDALNAHRDTIAHLYERTPQTNEVARAMPLLVGLADIAERANLPLRVLDIGASAGLNARLDRYRYEGDGWSWGDPASPLVLRNSTRSGRPSINGDVRVVARAACDLHPLDISLERDRTELRSFVWADQLERFVRLNNAIAAANRVPLAVDAADMFAWIPVHARPLDGAVTVIMHSIIAEHLTPELRERLERTIEGTSHASREAAPIAWLRMEQADSGVYETRATTWPWGCERMIARSDGHGQHLQWN